MLSPVGYHTKPSSPVAATVHATSTVWTPSELSASGTPTTVTLPNAGTILTRSAEVKDSDTDAACVAPPSTLRATSALLDD